MNRPPPDEYVLYRAFRYRISERDVESASPEERPAKIEIHKEEKKMLSAAVDFAFHDHELNKARAKEQEP